MKKGWKILISSLLVLAVGSELLLPWLAERWLAQSLANEWQCQSVDVKLTQHPGIGLLSGTIAAADIVATEAKLDKITLHEVVIHVEGARVSLPGLLEKRGPGLQSVEKASMQADITQEELGRYLSQNVKGVRQASVVVSPEKIKVSSQLQLSIAQLAVQLEGRIITDEYTVKFASERFGVNSALTGTIGGSLMTDIVLLDARKLPFGLRVRDAALQAGHVRVRLDTGRQ